MKIYIFSSKKTPFPGLKGAELLGPEALGRHSPEQGDMSYLDLSSFTEAEAKKALSLLKRRCGVHAGGVHAAWGIIDPKDSVDPAAFFFEGASDYLGSKLLKKGPDPRRLKKAASWRTGGIRAGGIPASGVHAGGSSAAEDSGEGAEAFVSKAARLPAGKFTGWNAYKAGTVSPFFFCYAALSGRTSLRSRLGETSFKVLMGRLRTFLVPRFQDARALLWMETEDNCLFLIPPRAEYARAAEEAALKILMGSTFLIAENLGLTIPAVFTFALHYGKTAYRAPGRTGTVVSDAVNFIFHLGTKCAESGRLTYSDEIPPDALAPQLEDMFVNAGSFEGRNLRHSLRFTCSGELAGR
ncbi:MAG: hypothetical protein LBQ14_10505 [Treponema sp.]|jgi:hypothetical protein|nr:hypothetical protein [Treponema sp.]